MKARNSSGPFLFYMAYSVYILYSESSHKFYIGQTVDLEKRVNEHNTQLKNAYTSKYRPWKLVAFLEVDSRKIAMAIEKYLKKKNRKFIERVVNEHTLRSFIVDKFSSDG